MRILTHVPGYFKQLWDDIFFSWNMSSSNFEISDLCCKEVSIHKKKNSKKILVTFQKKNSIPSQCSKLNIP